MMNKSTTSIATTSNIALDEQTREQLYALGALEWTTADIAAFFGWNRCDLEADLQNPMSDIAGILHQAKLRTQFEIENKLYKEAAKGNFSAIQEFYKVKRTRSFELSKADVFGAPLDSATFARIQDYIANGSRGTLSDEEQHYIDLLVMVWSLDGQYGKAKTVKFLVAPPFSMSYERASDVYHEATELFFTNRKTTKEALRNKIADELDSIYHLAREAATTPKDYAECAKILEKQAHILRLDVDEPPLLPTELYARQIRVLTLTPETIGLPSVNRDKLAAQIDSLDVSDRVKKRLRMEASIEDIDFIEVLNNGVQEKD